MPTKLFITGIGTEVGKSVASALLVAALEADYWKPVQSGDLDFTDSDKIAKWAECPPERIHPETFRLNTPASPHYSALKEGLEIRLSDFHLPRTDNHLIVEGAGGLLVPLNNSDTMLDLIQQLGLEVVLVANFYLGSINHSLMSIKILKERRIPIRAMFFMGPPTESSRSIIMEMGKDDVKHFISIPRLDKMGDIPNAAKELVSEFRQLL